MKNNVTLKNYKDTENVCQFVHSWQQHSIYTEFGILCSWSLLLFSTLLFSTWGCTRSFCPDESTAYGILKKEVICYKDKSVKHGVHIKWHPKGDIKAFERHYINNILDGPYREWYSNGVRKTEITYRLGKLNGIYLQWYSNGQLKTRARYVDNIHVGSYIKYYKNGNPKLEFNYTPLGGFDGNQTEYRLNGHKLKQDVYMGGKLIGKKFWRIDGTLDPILKRF